MIIVLIIRIKKTSNSLHIDYIIATALETWLSLGIYVIHTPMCDTQLLF